MTIETLLELKLDMMGDAYEALAVLQETWEGKNRPTKSQDLIRVLKITLDRCNQRGIVYPRIFLLRKGELQRGEFQPLGKVSSVIDPAAVKFTAASHPKIPADWIRQAVEESIKSARAKYGKRPSSVVGNRNEPADGFCPTEQYQAGRSN